MTDIDIFIDASYSTNHRAGVCGAILVDENETEFFWKQKLTDVDLKQMLNLEPPKAGYGSTTYEFLSLLKFSKVLLKKNLKNLNVVCYTDSQNLFCTFYNLMKCKGIQKTIFDEIQQTLNFLYELGFQFEIRWVPSHKDIYHNRIVDRLCNLKKVKNPMKRSAVLKHLKDITEFNQN